MIAYNHNEEWNEPQSKARVDPVQSLMKPPMNQVKSLEEDEASQWWLIDSGASEHPGLGVLGSR